VCLGVSEVRAQRHKDAFALPQFVVRIMFYTCCQGGKIRQDFQKSYLDLKFSPDPKHENVSDEQYRRVG
jgi:hypothetical protein